MTIPQFKETLARAAHDPAFLGSLILGTEATLYTHQVNVLRRMGPPVYSTGTGEHNTALMGPLQSGITTIMLVMAAWHGIFQPGKTAVFLMRDANAVKDFKTRLTTVLRQLRHTLGVMHDSIEALPGRIVIKTTSIPNIKAQKGDEVSAVYIDTPPSDVDAALMKKIGTAIWASTSSTQNILPRFHLLTSGYNPAIAQIIRQGHLNTVPFVGEKVLSREMFSEQRLDELFNELGEAKFLSSVVCIDPRDPNAYARFLHGEI